jgi:hypothetical protein
MPTVMTKSGKKKKFAYDKEGKQAASDYKAALKKKKTEPKKKKTKSKKTKSKGY